MNTKQSRLRRKRLDQFMSGRGLTAAEWTRRAGVNPNALYNFFAGRSESLHQSTLEKLADAEHVTVSEMLGETLVTMPGDFTRVKVVGALRPGDWKEAIEWPSEEQYFVWYPPVSELYSGKDMVALLLQGDSMDNAYPDGSILIVVPLDKWADDIDALPHVIVTRRNAAGLVEASCKELVVRDDDRAFLVPDSTNPEHATLEIPWPYAPDKAPNGGEDTISISHIVIGAMIFAQPKKRH